MDTRASRLVVARGQRRTLVLWAFENRRMGKDATERRRAFRWLLADLRTLARAQREGDLDAFNKARGEVQTAIERLARIYREVQQRVQLGAVSERQRNAQRLQAKKRSADTRQRVKRLADKHLSGIPRSKQVAVLQSAWPVSRERLSDKQVRNILKDLGFRR